MEEDVVTRAEKILAETTFEEVEAAENILSRYIIDAFSAAVKRIRDAFKNFFEWAKRAVSRVVEQLRQLNDVLSVPPNNYDFRRDPYNGKRYNNYRFAYNHDIHNFRAPRTHNYKRKS